MLCLIVLFHIVLVSTSQLSPWKGGGFGMFSTVDSPGARFLRIFLVSEEGEIPVFVPKPLRELSQEIRTIPTANRTKELAEQIAAGIWVRLRMTSAVGYYRELLGEPAADYSDDDPVRESSVGATVDFDEFDFVRMLEESETLGQNDSRVGFDAVRVETWRYTFNNATRTLDAERIAEVRVPAGPEE